MYDVAGTRSRNTLYVFDITTSGSLLGNARIVERSLIFEAETSDPREGAIFFLGARL